MQGRTWTRVLLAMGFSALAAGCTEETAAPAGPAPGGDSPEFEATIRWTSYGIPHVGAKDWRGLGYGFAYATARDAVCVIARDLVMVKGETTRWFGTGNGNLESDVFHRAILTDGRIRDFLAGQDTRSVHFSQGYVAGYNRYLRDNGAGMPDSCAGEPWLQPMSELDLARLTIGVGIRYGLGRVQREMAGAAPPVDEGLDQAAALSTDFDLPAGIGSNAVALGRAVTESGRGILLGNPHYPWHGSSRFHLIHTTIPGEVDVMGVSLYTTSRVSIGFNRDVAWSHTVSTGLRSTLYELTLHPEDPLQYRYGDGYRRIEEVSVPVTTVGEDGKAVTSAQTVYFSHYGPMVESDSLPWGDGHAYTIRDANLNNTRAGETYDALNKAASVAEVEAAISLQGVAWTNTISADRHGDAFYADISVTPNMDSAQIDRCRVKVSGVPERVVVLDGADPDCEWRADSRSGVADALPAEEMPRLKRDDFVANSNDSYWLSNPAAPLEGYSSIIGAERTVRSLRTRAGLQFIDEAITNGKITPDDVQAMLYSQRNFGAELLLDDVLTLCTADMAPVAVDGREADLAPACAALTAWDRRNTVDSRGGHLWREFWRHAQGIDGVYAVPFDVQDPVGTPRGIAVTDPEVRPALLEALGKAVLALEDAGIAPDARLGDIQFAERNGERIPIPGGEGWAGMWSMIVTDLEPGVGYSPIRHGNSYIQVISWDRDGKLDPRAIITYSQSPEPESPHYADMTRLYAEGGWVSLPFEDAEIDADPNLVSLTLRE